MNDVILQLATVHCVGLQDELFYWLVGLVCLFDWVEADSFEGNFDLYLMSSSWTGSRSNLPCSVLNSGRFIIFSCIHHRSCLLLLVCICSSVRMCLS